MKRSESATKRTKTLIDSFCTSVRAASVVALACALLCVCACSSKRAKNDDANAPANVDQTPKVNRDGYLVESVNRSALKFAPKFKGHPIDVIADSLFDATSFTKDDFETSEEYRQRAANEVEKIKRNKTYEKTGLGDVVVFPIAKNDLEERGATLKTGDKIGGLKLKYDADRQRLTFGLTPSDITNNDDSDALSKRLDASYDSVETLGVCLENDAYKGQNIYGATREIRSLAFKEYAVVFPIPKGFNKYRCSHVLTLDEVPASYAKQYFDNLVDAASENSV